MKKAVLVILIVLPLFCQFFVPAFCSQTTGLIFIREDGSIEGTNKIHRSGDTYIFSGDIEGCYGIIVEKSDIIIDGKGHTLKSVPRLLPLGSWDFGVELSNKTRGNVTVTNLKILDFNIGVYIWNTENTVIGNTIIGGNVGVFLAESPNKVISNYIKDNGEGIFLGPLPDTHPVLYNVVYQNTFVNNTRQVYDCECTDPHTIQHLNVWDDGEVGNYWSNYNGTDQNSDGIGDIPYAVSDDDTDFYPLMEPVAKPIGDNSFFGTGLPFELGLVLSVGLVVVVICTVYLLMKRKRSKNVG
ncbi:MAG: hypothetical protein NWF03_00515 [Candidatus Bathyarchaeota archaeon]|nr:hypothetical protein [Candidatus Bathyarchaeota archaeon]